MCFVPSTRYCPKGVVGFFRLCLQGPNDEEQDEPEPELDADSPKDNTTQESPTGDPSPATGSLLSPILALGGMCQGIR